MSWEGKTITWPIKASTAWRKNRAAGEEYFAPSVNSYFGTIFHAFVPCGDGWVAVYENVFEENDRRGVPNPWHIVILHGSGHVIVDGIYTTLYSEGAAMNWANSLADSRMEEYLAWRKENGL